MTIKIEKETEVNLDESRGELGTELIWYWVRCYDERNFVKLQKVFRIQETAQKVYEGLIAYYEKNGTVEPKHEIIATHETITPQSSEQP